MSSKSSLGEPQIPEGVNLTNQTPPNESSVLIGQNAMSVNRLAKLDLTLPDLEKYQDLATAMARNAQGPDTLEAANHRLAILLDHHKDSPEILTELQNFEFREAVAFDEGVLRPHLVIKDLTRCTDISDTSKAWLQGKGMKTSTLALKDPSVPIREEERQWGVYLRLDDEGVAIPGSPTYFDHDLSGISAHGRGTPKIHKRNKGFATYLMSQYGKSLADITSHIPSQDAYVQFMNALPLSNREKAFLLNLLFAGYRDPDDDAFDSQDAYSWVTSDFDGGDVWNACLDPDKSLVLGSWSNRNSAVPVVLFSDMV